MRVVGNAIAKGIEQGFSPSQITEGVVNRIELALELELDEVGSGVVADFPILPREPEKRPDLDKLAPPPVATVQHRDSSLILAPDSPEAKEILAKPVRPIRMPLPTADLPTNPNAKGPQRFWSQPQLRDYIEAQTPADLPVMAQGRAKPVHLIRNIEVLPGVDLVKLSYSLGMENHPVSSQRNSPTGGEELTAIAVDTPVFETFSCFDREPSIEGKLDRIREAAAFAYRPKADTIPSSTPRRSGFLGYNASDPHDSVGPTVNPHDGKEW